MYLFPLYRRVRVGLFYELSSPSYDHLFKKVEKRRDALVLTVGPSRRKEVFIKITNPRCREVTPVAPGKEKHLVIKVE